MNLYETVYNVLKGDTQQVGNDVNSDGVLEHKTEKQKSQLDEAPAAAAASAVGIAGMLVVLYKAYKNIKKRSKAIETKCGKLSGIEKDLCVINVKIDEVEAKKKAVAKFIDPNSTDDPEKAYAYKRKREDFMASHNNHIYRLKLREKKLKKKLRDQSK